MYMLKGELVVVVIDVVYDAVGVEVPLLLLLVFHSAVLLIEKVS